MFSTRVLGLVAVGTLLAGSIALVSASQSAGTSVPNGTVSAAAGHKTHVTKAQRVGADVFGPSVDVLPGGNGIANATCKRGYLLTGGGGATSQFDIFFTDSFRSGPRTWTTRGTNTGTTTQSIRAFARCIPR